MEPVCLHSYIDRVECYHVTGSLKKKKRQTSKRGRAGTDKKKKRKETRKKERKKGIFKRGVPRRTCLLGYMQSVGERETMPCRFLPKAAA